MNRFLKFLFVFLIGALSYLIIELLWRGHTHVSMFLAGGICFYALFLIETRSRGSLFIKCLMGSAIITVIELVIGITVNMILGLSVWDYSRLPLNFLGQISLVYSGLWFLLCIPALRLCRYIDKFMNIKAQRKREKYFGT